MTHIYYLPCYDFVNNIWWRVPDMNLTTESSASLYSYLPLTSNIPLTIPLSQTLHLCSSLDTTPTFTPTQNDRNNVSFTEQYMQHSELKGDKYCLHLSCYSSKIMVLLTFCQDLTHIKPDLQQSDSGTSQAMWHKILIALDFTTRTAQNPFSTVQICHEYWLPQKPHIPNIC